MEKERGLQHAAGDAPRASTSRKGTGAAKRSLEAPRSKWSLLRLPDLLENTPGCGHITRNRPWIPPGSRHPNKGRNEGCGGAASPGAQPPPSNPSPAAPRGLFLVSVLPPRGLFGSAPSSGRHQPCGCPVLSCGGGDGTRDRGDGDMEPAGPEPSLYTVKALLVLDSLGQRLLAKYYDSTFPTAKEQLAFERSIFRQSQRAGGEVVSLQGLTIVYRSSGDLCFYVVGGGQENELMLLSVLTCLLDALGHLLQKEVEKRWLLANMEGTFLVVDEIVDRGVILESDPQQVIQRLSLQVPEPAPYGFILFDYLSGSSEQKGSGNSHK
ncbi:coatomer subunit zeta-2 isoform X3 [Lathamus discolor]